MQTETHKGKLIWIFIFLAIAYVVWFNYHKFVSTKDYDFFVEAPCDITVEECFLRDCEEYCPPNGLVEYKVWLISASDFDSCSDDSCNTECTSGEIICKAVPCEEDEWTTCVRPLGAASDEVLVVPDSI